MVNTIRSICGTPVLASFAMLAAPFALHAAAPVFDNWTIDGGAIEGTTGATPCGTGFTCETLTVGDGFIQVQWVDANTGDAYIQTVITDAGATGSPGDLTYVDESFVRLGSNNGIMARQRNQQEGTDGVFTNSSTLAIGWANPNPDGSNPNMIIEQSFESEGVPAVTGDEFLNAFTMRIVNATDTNPRSQSMTVEQQLGLGDGITASADAQHFLLEDRQGAFTETDGTMTLDPSIGFSFGGGAQDAQNGGNVTWEAGEQVVMTWIGQRLDLGNQGLSQFGFQAIRNVTPDSEQEATTFSTSSADISDGAGGFRPPFDWHATFGPDAPALP